MVVVDLHLASSCMRMADLDDGREAARSNDHRVVVRVVVLVHEREVLRRQVALDLEQLAKLSHQERVSGRVDANVHTVSVNASANRSARSPRAINHRSNPAFGTRASFAIDVPQQVARASSTRHAASSRQARPRTSDRTARDANLDRGSLLASASAPAQSRRAPSWRPVLDECRRRPWVRACPTSRPPPRCRASWPRTP